MIPDQTVRDELAHAAGPGGVRMNAQNLDHTQYLDRTRRSREIYERLTRVLPGGETRAAAWFPPYPIVADRGAGSHLFDVDGNEYIDLLNNYTSLIHGHAHPVVTDSLVTAARSGTVHPAPHLSQLQLAELLTDRFPGMEQVRFTNSGSEAAILAARIAFSLTGRSKLVLMDGGYHGTGYLFADPNPHVVRVSVNDIAALQEAVDETVAAVFIEPFLGSAGVIPASREYLLAAQQTCADAGALFVLDEIQALRSAINGVHGQFGLHPDLVLMGKIIGGGLPVGAVGGSGSTLKCVATSGGGAVKHSGTFNGNVATMAAGAVAMRLLDAAAIDRLNAQTVRLSQQITDSAAEHGLEVSVTHFGSILHVHFLTAPPSTAAEARLGSHHRNAVLHEQLLLNGVFTAARGMANLSTALSESDMGAVAAAYDRSLMYVAQEGGR